MSSFSNHLNSRVTAPNTDLNPHVLLHTFTAPFGALTGPPLIARTAAIQANHSHIAAQMFPETGMFVRYRCMDLGDGNYQHIWTGMPYGQRQRNHTPHRGARQQLVGGGVPVQPPVAPGLPVQPPRNHTPHRGPRHQQPPVAANQPPRNNTPHRGPRHQQPPVAANQPPRNHTPHRGPRHQQPPVAANQPPVAANQPPVAANQPPRNHTPHRGPRNQQPVGGGLAEEAPVAANQQRQQRRQKPVNMGPPVVTYR